MKKMLAILLSAVMVLALLAGCGSEDNDREQGLRYAGRRRPR